MGTSNLIIPPGSTFVEISFGVDLDFDGIANQIDIDDDGDGIIDTNDECQFGIQFISNTANDRDQDGCRDIDEDLDDDGDTVLDTVDSCPNGVTYWTPSDQTDYDGDGCYDPTEDFDDDNDGYEDFEDMCPRLFGNSTYTNELGCPDDDGDGRA